MKFGKIVFALLILLLASTKANAQVEKTPHAGYIFPAGGKRGSTIRVVVGGQFLKKIRSAEVTGKNISIKVVDHLRGMHISQHREMDYILKDKLSSERKQQGRPARNKRKRKYDKDVERIALPKGYPLFDFYQQTDSKTMKKILKELRHPTVYLQRKIAIAERIVLEITIGKDAELGPREIRLKSKMGLTEPLKFWVGKAKDYVEPPWFTYADRSKTILKPSVTIHGQILPREVDDYKFTARKGQVLTIFTRARELVPFMSDSVPGWFQPVVEIYDSKNNRVAYCDDFDFHPDPVIIFSPSKTDTYTLRIRDSIYRGRADFTYMITISEMPFVKEISPILPSAEKIFSQVVFGDKKYYRTQIIKPRTKSGLKNYYYFSGWVVDGRLFKKYNLPIFKETISKNDSMTKAQQVKVGSLIQGKLTAKGDVDYYKFSATAGQEVVVDVVARKAGSSVDTVIYLMNKKGKVIAWSDDASVLSVGLHTHFADAKLSATIPKSGEYYIRISDVRNITAPAGEYFLRVSKPRPDYRVFYEPSSFSLKPGETKKITAHVERLDGFLGEVKLRVANRIPGLFITGATIPEEKNKVTFTITAPRPGRKRVGRDRVRFKSAFNFKLNAIAMLNGKPATRLAIPADDITQAFVLHHIVPTTHCKVQLAKGGAKPPIYAKLNSRLKIQPGKPTLVQVNVPRWLREKNQYSLELVDPPAGLIIAKQIPTRTGFAIQVYADETALPSVGNLIFKIRLHRQVNFYQRRRPNRVITQKREKTTVKKVKQFRIIPIGLLPAVPYEILPIEY